MEFPISQLAMYGIGVLAAGGGLGWLIRGVIGNQRLNRLCDDWQMKYDTAARQRDTFNAENGKLRTTIEAQQAVVHKHELAASKMRTEFASATEKIKAQAKDLFSVGAERDELRKSLDNSQSALNAANQQLTHLEAEFEKAGDFYKAELEKSFDARKEQKTDLDNAKAEHESLTNLLQASRAEHESVNKMLSAAQTRLNNLDAMEQKVIELEAENAQLRHDAAGVQQTIETLQRDVAELEELKVQNRELAHCLKSMETSRQQYEQDAARYRERAEQSDKRSETLRVKLGDVEKSFSEMAKQHDEALRIADEKPAAPEPEEKADKEVDDLTKIVGIGKVFQETLHSLGIYSYRQIASFGPADIARVNMELKEFRGRMEQDDWIGQAKDLLFHKYGETH